MKSRNVQPIKISSECPANHLLGCKKRQKRLAITLPYVPDTSANR